MGSPLLACIMTDPTRCWLMVWIAVATVAVSGNVTGWPCLFFSTCFNCIMSGRSLK